MSSGEDLSAASKQLLESQVNSDEDYDLHDGEEIADHSPYDGSHAGNSKEWKVNDYGLSQDSPQLQSSPQGDKSATVPNDRRLAWTHPRAPVATSGQPNQLQEDSKETHGINEHYKNRGLLEDQIRSIYTDTPGVTDSLTASAHLDSMYTSRSNHSPPDGASSLYSASMGAMATNTQQENTDLYAISPQYSPIDISKDDKTLAAVDQKLSINPDINMDIHKLEVALSYLGIEPSAEQREELRGRLQPNDDNMVSYGAFVQVVRDMFSLQLQEISPLSPTSSLPGGLHGQHTSKQEDEMRHDKTHIKKLESEIDTLRALLVEKERVLKQTGEQLAKTRRELDKADAAQRSLETRLQLAEAAQRAARNTELDYEDVVRGLEAQLAQSNVTPMEHPEVQRRLAVLGCQLKKAEVSRKTYEVATNKLLQFAEIVRSSQLNRMAGIQRRERSMTDVDGPGGPRYLSTKATHVIQAVMALLDVEPLPFGWDEAYTKDGLKYYTNHVTQLTSWQHPLTNVQEVMTTHPPPAPSTGSLPKSKTPNASRQ